MNKCWAAVLGGCSGKISGEHMVSKSIFTAGTVSVKGLPWCGLNYKQVGIGALTSNILCTTHNTLLSPTDSQAGRLAADMRSRGVLSDQRNRDRNPPFPLVSYTATGNLIERWLIKTTINLYHQAPSHWTWHESGSAATDPPEDFVRAAFGLSQLQHPYGFYFWSKLGDTIPGVPGVSFTSLHDPSDALVGAVVDLSTLRFLIWLSRLPPEPDWMYRTREINFNDAEHPSQRLSIVW